MLKELMGRRARIALTAALVSLALPAAAQAGPGSPDLVQGAPTNVSGGFFDDHSIAGDNHAHWAPGAEPYVIRFRTAMRNDGPGELELCGYRTTGPWMRLHQVFSGGLGDGCDAAPSGPQRGWARYVPANHAQPGSDPPVYNFNRWHVMDLQRFALVPLPTSLGGPGASVQTVWDTRWGTCLGVDAAYLDCEHDADATTLDVGLESGATKVMQDGADDDQAIAIPQTLRAGLPNGNYQLVAIANPYGALVESGGGSNVACTTIALGNQGGPPAVSMLDASPATCWVPQTLPPAQDSSTQRDPLTLAAQATPCPVRVDSLHCWPPPEAPAVGPTAQSQATGSPTATDAVPVAMRAASTPAPTPPGAGTTPVTTGRSSSTTRRINARVSRTYTRTALRKQFGRGLSRLRVTCRVRSSTASTCSVSWRKSGARYSGHVWLRYRTVNSRLRWQYRVEVKKRKSGERTRTITRSYRTGGTF